MLLEIFKVPIIVLAIYLSGAFFQIILYSLLGGFKGTTVVPFLLKTLVILSWLGLVILVFTIVKDKIDEQF